MSIMNTLAFLVLVVSTTVVIADSTVIGPISDSTSDSGSICPAPGSPVLRDDYTYTPCIGAHRLHKTPSRWNEARKICQEEGGHLAIINSIAEARLLQNVFQNLTASDIVGTNDTNNAAIGIHDHFELNNFVTVHGDSIYKAGYSEWAAGQPDNAWDGENCGAITRDGTLNDVGCEQLLVFFCEVPYVEE